MAKKKGIDSEREFANLSCTDITHCERVSGSGNRFASVCDVVLFTKKFTALIELKTIRDKVFYVRGHVKEQLDKLYEVSLKVNKIAMLAVKFKYVGWYYIVVTSNIPTVLRPSDMILYNPKKINEVVIDEKTNSRENMGVYE